MASQHLFFRGKSYHFVARIPRDVVRFFPLPTIWRTLKTDDPKHARCLLKAIEYRAEKTYMQIRSGMLTEDQIQQLVADFLHNALGLTEASRTATSSTRNVFTTTDEGIDALSGAYRELAVELQRELARGDVGLGEAIADAIIEEKGLTVDPSSDDYRRLARTALVAEIARLGVEGERTSGNYDSDAERRSFDKYPLVKAKPLMRLSSLIDKYVDHKVTSGDWSEKSVSDMKSSYSLLLRIKGDFVLGDVDFDFAQDFRKRLLVVPPNWSKGRYKDFSIEALAAMKEAQELPSMSIGNINKNLQRLADLFSFALAKGFYEGTNHFSGLRLADPETDNEKRRGFTKREIHLVVDHLLLLLERKFLEGDGRLAIDESYVWVFLLCLYLGYRSNEVCQMTVDDVYYFNDILVMEVKHEPKKNKRTKNKQSRRIVPVPPQVLDLGLAEYLKERTASGKENLWDCARLGAFGKWNRSFGDNINKYIDEALGGQDNRICFHSTRHNLGNELRALEVSLDTIQGIKGHRGRSTEENFYWEANLTKQRDAISRLDYGLNLNAVRQRIEGLHRVEDESGGEGLKSNGPKRGSRKNS